MKIEERDQKDALILRALSLLHQIKSEIDPYMEERKQQKQILNTQQSVECSKCHKQVLSADGVQKPNGFVWNECTSKRKKRTLLATVAGVIVVASIIVWAFTGNDKQIGEGFSKNSRKIEKALIRNKETQKPMIALGRLLTKFENQAVPYSSYLKQLEDNPKLKRQLAHSVEGSSKNLEDNMRLLGTDKWVKKNERIRRYLEMPKRQVEAHHVIPCNPETANGRGARKIWVKYFDSVDHPCNGIWLGKCNKESGYWGIAKGTNHSPNSVKYEQKVSTAVLNTYKKYQKRYANNPEKMRQVLAETVDNLKKQLYKGELAIGRDSHRVHTAWSIFKDKNESGIISNAAQNILYPF